MIKALLNLWDKIFHAMVTFPCMLCIECFIYENLPAILAVVLLGIFAGVGIFKFGAPAGEVLLITYFLIVLLGMKDWLSDLIRP